MHHVLLQLIFHKVCKNRDNCSSRCFGGGWAYNLYCTYQVCITLLNCQAGYVNLMT